MTTELVLLLSLTVFVLAAFLGKGGIGDAFENSAPKLGAQIERSIETGSGFTSKAKNLPDPILWSQPPGNFEEKK